MFLDYIEGMPVRCFYTPIFSKTGRSDDLIVYNYGKNREFKIGDKLPLETMWYRYPENLMILSLRDNKFIAYIIKNGILLDSKYANEIDECIFDDIGTVINSDGDFISIKSCKDIGLYIDDMHNYMEIVRSLESYNEYLVSNLNTTYSSIRIISSAISVKSLLSFIEYEDISDINAFLNRKFMTNNMSLMEIKSFIYFNRNIFSKIDITMLKNILRKKYEMKYIELDIKYEEHFNFYEEQIKLHKGILNEKWKGPKIFEKEKRFGEVLECLRWSFQNKDDYFFTEKIMNNFIYWCLREINGLVKANPDLFCKYRQWNDFPIDDIFDMDNIFNLIEDCKF